MRDSRSKRSGSDAGEGRRARDSAPEGKPPSLGRVIAAAVSAILLAAGVARLTLASDFAEEDAESAFGLAPDSPDSIASMAMVGVGQAAASGEDPDRTTMYRLKSLAAVAPLRPEPFLVKAALAERAGDLDRAEKLILKARSLEPRSAAGRYLLADVWLRQDKVAPALSEMALLARLVPATSAQLIPALANFARSPGAREKLVPILASNPKLRTPLLSALAADPGNADLIMALAGPEARSTETASLRWKSRLLKGLVASGDYQRAHAVWSRFVELPEGSRQLLFNGEFRKVDAPEPFGWKFSSGRAGLAEPENGTLRVLYYGTEDFTLASQLLLLDPGTYMLRSPIMGTVEASALEWRLTCPTARHEIMKLDISAHPPAVRFSVPAACPAQLLELVGRAAETPKDSDLQIGPVRIERVRA